MPPAPNKKAMEITTNTLSEGTPYDVLFGEAGHTYRISEKCCVRLKVPTRGLLRMVSGLSDQMMKEASLAQSREAKERVQGFASVADAAVKAMEHASEIFDHTREAARALAAGAKLLVETAEVVRGAVQTGHNLAALTADGDYTVLQKVADLVEPAGKQPTGVEPGGGAWPDTEETYPDVVTRAMWDFMQPTRRTLNEQSAFAIASQSAPLAQAANHV